MSLRFHLGAALHKYVRFASNPLFYYLLKLKLLKRVYSAFGKRDSFSSWKEVFSQPLNFEGSTDREFIS